MATFFSNQTIWNWGSSAYPVKGTLTGNVSRSGNTVTLSGMNLALSWPPYASGTWGVSFTVNGTTTGRNLAANTANYGVNNTSFGVGTTQTSANIGWSSSDGFSGSFTVTFPSGASGPSGGAVAWQSHTWNSVTIKSSLSSWGSGYSGTPNLEQIVCVSTSTSSNWDTDGQARSVKQNATTATSSTQTVYNTTDDWHPPAGKVTIKGCLSYKVAMWGATNIGNTKAFDNTTRYTPPAPLQTLSAGTQTYAGANKANIPLTIVGGSSSNNYTVNVNTQYRYSTNGGSTWTAWASAGNGNPWTSVSATITVPCDTSVQIQAKQVYQSQSSEVKSLTVTSIKTPARTYVSVNGKSKLARKAYFSVRALTDLSGTIESGGPENVMAFDPSTFSTAVSSMLDNNKTLKQIVVTAYGSPFNDYCAWFYYQDMSNTQIANHVSGSALSSFGITAPATPGGSGNDIIKLTPVYGGKSRKVLKIYKGVSGKSKLVYTGQ